MLISNTNNMHVANEVGDARKGAESSYRVSCRKKVP